MIGGFIAGLVVFAIGAILDFAVTTSTYQSGVDLNTVGLILMIVGAVGAGVSLVLVAVGCGSFHRRRTVIDDDGRGRVVRREDTYL